MNNFQHQIATTHAELIRLGVAVREDRDLAPTLFELFKDMEEAGWSNLVRGMIDFVEGRDIDIEGMDDEDQAILIAMQRGHENKDFLISLELDAAKAAAPALGALIYAATQGEREALEAMAGLHDAADTATALATAEALIDIIEGARNPEALAERLPPEQARLVQAILEQLSKLEN